MKIKITIIGEVDKKTAEFIRDNGIEINEGVKIANIKNKILYLEKGQIIRPKEELKISLHEPPC